MKKYAITGTIGAGKSTVSILLRRKNFPVFDCDQYAKSCYRKDHPIYQKMITIFTEDILDETGEIDRKKVANIVFQDEKKRLALNELIHPYVKDGLEHFFSLNEDKILVFAEVPLLYEAGWENLFDKVIVVTCEDRVAIERLQEYRGFTKKEALKRLEAQIDAKEQIDKADIVLHNNSTILELDDAVDEMLKGELEWN